MTYWNCQSISLSLQNFLVSRLDEVIGNNYTFLLTNHGWFFIIKHLRIMAKLHKTYFVLKKSNIYPFKSATLRRIKLSQYICTKFIICLPWFKVAVKLDYFSSKIGPRFYIQAWNTKVTKNSNCSSLINPC